MPYCVNCGVHLNENARSCPLCSTDVLFPAERYTTNPTTSSNLPIEVIEEEFDRGLWIKIISITLIMPAIISLLTNWVFQRVFSWSAYVVASLIFTWSWSISPFLFKRQRLVKWIPIAAATLIGFLYIIEKLTGSAGWFLTMGLPITLSFFIIFSMLVILIKKRVLKELHKAAAIILSIGIFCVCIDGAINLYNHQAIHLAWSLIVLTTCIAFALIGFVLQQRPQIVESIKHYLHY